MKSSTEEFRKQLSENFRFFSEVPGKGSNLSRFSYSLIEKAKLKESGGSANAVCIKLACGLVQCNQVFADKLFLLFPPVLQNETRMR